MDFGLIPPFVGAWFRGVGLAGGGKPSPPKGPGYERGRVREAGDAFNLSWTQHQYLPLVQEHPNEIGHLTDDILSDGEEAARSYGKSSNALDGDGVGRG